MGVGVGVGVVGGVAGVGAGSVVGDGSVVGAGAGMSDAGATGTGAVIGVGGVPCFGMNISGGLSEEGVPPVGISAGVRFRPGSTVSPPVGSTGLSSAAISGSSVRGRSFGSDARPGKRSMRCLATSP